jgi:hypothetical protein
MRVLAPALVLIALLAGSAHAEALNLAPAPQTATPRLDLTIRASADPAYAKMLDMRAHGLAQTSIDAKVGDNGAVSSFGFLCGLYPGQNLGGVHEARGYDPQGKFMGAKLALPF